MKKSAWLAVVLVLGLAVTGCGSKKGGSIVDGNSPNPDDGNPKEPVTIKVFKTSSVPITDEAFAALYADPVKTKYPNITVELIRTGKGTTIDDVIAAGDIPDMLMIWNGQMPEVKKYDLFMDISPLIKKYKVDLNRFEPVVLDAIRVVSDNKELYGLPYAQQFNALYYNKDIFDKFGVEYPKDGMTWDDAIALAKRVTREDSGVKFRGLDPEQMERLAFPLGLEMVDFKTNKAIVNNEQWKLAFETAKKIYEIPGNDKSVGGSFYKDKNIAMYAMINVFDALAQATKEGFTNWDVAQYPSYSSRPNTYGMVDTHVLTINKTSKHPDEAMKVLSVVTSDEVQLVSAKQVLWMTPLKNPDIQKSIGAGNPYFKDKHIAGIFKSKPAPAPVFSPYHSKAKSIMNTNFNSFLSGNMDVMTALRDAEDKINVMLASQ